METRKYRDWFTALKEELETAYLRHDESWKQSGFSGPEERWITCHKPIADCVDTSGKFLDIGCANGYLLECIVKWVADRELSIIPYGIDLSEKLVELAKNRLPEYSSNIYTANGMYWVNPGKFDYVRTELVYVPEDLQYEYLKRITEKYLSDSGKLLLSEYRSRNTPADTPWFDAKNKDWGLNITGQMSGFYDGQELTRIWVIKKPR